MKNEAPEAQYLRLSEETNALDYLERAAAFIKETPENIKAWKWVIIALHGALYGFAVAASCGTNYEALLTKRGKLLGFWDVLKLCQDPNHMKMLIHSRHLELTESQKESIEMMTGMLRNEFEHFQPKNWSIEIHGMPKVAIDVLEVIGFLAIETNTYVHLTEEEMKLVDQLTQENIEFVKGTQLYAEMKLAEELYEKEKEDST